jgi:fucose 4-O-acetylase-like acetyltransferase
MPLRVAWLDSLKGLGILLVVCGHQYLPPALHQWIYSFHVPLFFFISGCLFDASRYAGQAAYARRRSRTILVPYVVFGLATWLLWAAVRRPFGASHNVAIPLWKPLLGLLYGNATGDWLIFDSPLWFLPCIFVAANLFFWIHAHAKGGVAGALCLFASAAVGAVVVGYQPFPAPWGADLALSAAVFFGAGYCLRPALDRAMTAAPWLIFAAAAVALAAANLALSWRNGPVDMNSRSFGNPVVFYAAAFAGIGCWLAISRLLPPTRALAWLGRNTLVILAFHRPAGSLVEHVLGRRLWSLPFLSYSALLSWSAFHAAAAVVLCAPIAFAVNRYFPFVLGRRHVADIRREAKE